MDLQQIICCIHGTNISVFLLMIPLVTIGWELQRGQMHDPPHQLVKENRDDTITACSELLKPELPNSNRLFSFAGLIDGVHNFLHI